MRQYLFGWEDAIYRSFDQWGDDEIALRKTMEVIAVGHGEGWQRMSFRGDVGEVVGGYQR